MIYTTTNNVIKTIKIIQHLTLKYIKIFFILLAYFFVFFNTNGVLKSNEIEEELIFAPNADITSLYPFFSSDLSLSVFYGYNIKSFYDKIDSFILAVDINPFYNKSLLDWFGFLKNTTLKFDYSKVKLKDTTYISAIDNLHFNVNYNAIHNYFIVVYFGIGGGLTFENTRYINENNETILLKQDLGSYSFNVGANIWLKPFGDVDLFSFLSISKYLDNAYLYIEVKQYNTNQNSIKKHIDSYRYEIYNVGIKYSFPLVKKYGIKSL